MATINEKYLIRCLEEVEIALADEDPQKKNQLEILYRIYNTQLKLYGHTVPQQRKVAKKGFSFSKLTNEEILKVWNYVFMHSTYHETMQLSIFYYDNLLKKGADLIYAWSTFRKWATRIENWAHNDGIM